MKSLKIRIPRRAGYIIAIAMLISGATMVKLTAFSHAGTTVTAGESFGPVYVASLITPLDSSPQAADAPSAAPASLQNLPPVLNEADLARYRQLSTFQSNGDWDAANALIHEIENPILMGKIFAERFLSDQYPSTYNELNSWLVTYADHPEAPIIRRLAEGKRTRADAPLASIPKKSTLTGYGDDNGLGAPERRLDAVDEAAWIGRDAGRRLFGLIESHISNNELPEAEAKLNAPETAALLTAYETDVIRWHLAANYLYRGNPYKAFALASAAANRSGGAIPSAHWVAGISAWQVADYAAATRHFVAMANTTEKLSAWENSASAFWAYRSLEKTGRSSEAARYLALASEKPRTFYGILARKARGESINAKDDTLPELDSATVEALYAIPAARRAVALSQLGETNRAEDELRALFPDVAQNMRVSLLSLAQHLKLPAVQISMAKTLKSRGLVFNTALYPTPEWQPLTGFAVDPALVFAFARQESGFHPKARSHMGAMGIMQLMPDTARAMQSRVEGVDVSRVYEPEANLTLGQKYLDYLLENPLVDGNLIYLAAAYNAGPGNVASWKKSVTYNNDPLLFLESMPFGATRNYVAQVLTSYWMYQAIEGTPQNSAKALARGQWPRYDATTPRLAERSAPDRG